MTTKPEVERIEEMVTKMLAIGWDSKMKKHDGTSIVVSFTKAELVDLLLNIEETHHQELQKAYKEGYNDKDKEISELLMKDGITYDEINQLQKAREEAVIWTMRNFKAMHKEDWGTKTFGEYMLDRYQSELNQHTV